MQNNIKNKSYLESKDIEQKKILKNNIKVVMKDDILVRNIEYIKLQTNKETIEKNLLTLILFIMCIFTYITIRFKKKIAISLSVALLHNVIILSGICSLFNLEFTSINLLLLTVIISYFLNDTVFVFDTIRESIKTSKLKNTKKIVNKSIGSILLRAKITLAITFLVSLMLFFFGEVYSYKNLLILISSIIIGIYSSIYVGVKMATYLILKTKGKKKKLI
jgi:preprotein translocase subunit SecF